jgi:hypothetical protein
MAGDIMNKMQTLHSFWSGFGLKAYDENSVPDNAQLPYITYEASDDDFGNTLFQTANLWYRSSGWGEITEKEQEISDFITRGGRMVAFDDGAMWIQKGSPWAQRLEEPSDEMIRRIVLNITIEFMI